MFSASLISLFEGGHADPKLETLKLGRGRGIRDLVAIDKGFLVLAGPSEIDCDYTVYFWNGAKELRRLRDLPKFTGKKGKQVKPEGVLPLDSSAAGLRLLVLFDSAKEGAPRPLTVTEP